MCRYEILGFTKTGGPARVPEALTLVMTRTLLVPPRINSHWLVLPFKSVLQL
jgi:hypothetical protein